MNRYDDRVLIQTSSLPGSNGLQTIVVSYKYGFNPLDLIGDPQPPREKFSDHQFLLITANRIKDFDPYVEKLREKYEVREGDDGEIVYFFGPTSLITQFWHDLIAKGKSLQ